MKGRKKTEDECGPETGLAARDIDKSSPTEEIGAIGKGSLVRECDHIRSFFFSVTT